MRICLCYTCVTTGKRTADHAAKFLATYHQFQPGIEHDTLIICNGGPLKTEQAVMFSSLNAQLWPRQNDEGWDLTGYIEAANGPAAHYDMMLCLGESNYFHREGWLWRLAEAWEKWGPGMYGPYATNVVRAHLQTTAFACAPFLLRNYPYRVAGRKDRYEFEHGQQSLWRRTALRGMPVKLVTWDGEWDPRAWRTPKDIIWRGDQSNCLMWCNHSDGFAIADATRKESWARSADRPFK